MTHDACGHGEVLPSLKGECLCAAVARLGGEVARLTRERSEVEANYMKMIAAVLECGPTPAAQRPDDQLEPPWEVITRVRGERDALRALLGQLVEALRESCDWCRAAGDGGCDDHRSLFAAAAPALPTA